MNQSADSISKGRDARFDDKGVEQFAENDGVSDDVNPEALSTSSSEASLLVDGFKQKITCEYYDAIKDDFLSLEGIVHSLKKDGLIFVAESSLEIEMPILIRRMSPLKGCSKSALDKGAHAQVVSCKQYEEQNGKNIYKIGVQYF
jgi:hypothetical protein